MFGDHYNGVVGFFSVAGAVSGRKMLQKAIYLAKEFGFPGLRERFDFHWYGPFSETLANEVQELVQLGVLQENVLHRDTYVLYEYKLNDSAIGYFGQAAREAQRHRSLVLRIVKENARFLELAATLHYFTRLGCNEVEAEQQLARVKADKNYTSADIRSAWHFLAELETLRGGTSG